MEVNVIEVESKPIEDGKYVRKSIQIRHHAIKKFGPFDAQIDRIVKDVTDFDISKPKEIERLFEFIKVEELKGQLLVIATNTETSNEPFPDNFDDPVELTKEGEKIRDIPVLLPINEKNG